MKRKVLFPCTKNSARSQMAEAILNYRGSDDFGAVHPLALRVLGNAGFNVSGKTPKPMEEYLSEDFAIIITLCDRMKEKCPIFPGRPILAHWGMPDPAECEGTEEERLKCFEHTMDEISERINLFLSLP